MSVYYQNVAESFEKHFEQLSTKTESIHPFFAPNVVAKVFDEQVEGVDNVLKKLEPLLPFKNAITLSKGVAQPIAGGVLLTKIFESKGEKIMCTFQLKEVDTKDHRYGITACLFTKTK